MTLCFFSYGGNLDLFISGPGPLNNHYICNPQIACRYFVGSDIFPTPANDYFRQQKPANGFRIFVLGGSTTNGYPYGSNLMFSRILEHQLKAALPDRFVEVVNISTAAINSYALLDFMDEVLEQQPELILFYAGHNEYYGALGVASMINFGRHPVFVRTYLRLTKFKTFRLVRDIVFRLKRNDTTAPAPTATLMQRIVATHSISLNGELYQKGIEQFRGNLQQILNKAAKAHVPVILSELVSNTSDVPPFISTDDSESAHLAFEQAKQFEATGDYQSAKAEFDKARDLDGLRFRAPSEFNDIIRDCADQFGVDVVPMQSVFETASPNGLIGDDLMIDHLHPNLVGYFVMADAFLHRMQLAGFVPCKFKTDFEQHRHYTALDSLYGEFNILILKSGWPFTPNPASVNVLDKIAPKNIVEETALQVSKYDNVTIRQGHEKLANYYEKMQNEHNALNEYKALMALKTPSAIPCLKVCEALIKAEQPHRVPALVNESLVFDQSPLSYIVLGEAYNGLEHYAEAITAFEQAQRLGAPPHDPHIILGLTYAYRQTGQLDELQKLWAETGTSSASMQQSRGDAQLYQLLQHADQLIQANDFDRALTELQTSLRIRETDQAHTWIGQIYMQKRQYDLAIHHLEKARAMGSAEPLMLYNLSVALYQQKEVKRAQTILDELDKTAPQFGDPYDLKSKIANLLTP